MEIKRVREVLSCVIWGPPIGKGRPRFRVVAPKGKRPFAQVHPDAKSAKWEQRASVAMSIKARTPFSSETPVQLVVLAVHKRPQRLMRQKDPDGRLLRRGKPDGDNILKAVADALVLSDVIRDDKDVVDWRLVTVYGAKGEDPGVHVEVYEVESC